jgi:hypothetical protein
LDVGGFDDAVIGVVAALRRRGNRFVVEVEANATQSPRGSGTFRFSPLFANSINLMTTGIEYAHSPKNRSIFLSVTVTTSREPSFSEDQPYFAVSRMKV